jgi:hypothetical protein
MMFNPLTGPQHVEADLAMDTSTTQSVGATIESHSAVDEVDEEADPSEKYLRDRVNVSMSLCAIAHC